MDKLIVAPSPHVHSSESTTRIMRDVIIALMPALVVSVIVFGWMTLAVTAVSVLSCVLFEYLIQKYLLKGRSTVGDLSAVVTGVLLAFNLPVTIPLWIVVIGALVAIGVGKMTFGGIGKNPFNPALVGRVFLLISFPVQMTSEAFAVGATADAYSGATPLAFIKEGLKNGTPMSDLVAQINYQDLLLGFKAGSLGEVAALLLLVGFAYLLIRRVITWHIPVCFLSSFAILSWIFGGVRAGTGLFSGEILMPLFTGGIMLGAFFMATDWVTTPTTKKGEVIFAVGCGFFTFLIRYFGSLPEGVSLAIILMNILTPTIDRYVRPRKFGYVRPVKEAKSDQPDHGALY